MNELPGGGKYSSNGLESFAEKSELLRYLERYLSIVEPPLESGVEVQRIRQEGNATWLASTSKGRYRSRNVAVCTGAMSLPHIPAMAANLPPETPQLHSSAYRRPSQVGTNRVLLVGSGSSGTQIARDLSEHGIFSEIHLAKGNVRVLPRRVLRVPIHKLLHSLGLFDIEARSLLGRLMFSSLETGGDPVIRPGPNDLSRLYGIQVHGKLLDVNGPQLSFADDSTLDTDDMTVLWCTGFRADFGWIDSDLAPLRYDERGYPEHHRGEAKDMQGLFFVGLRYQHTVASHDFYGVGADAEYVADRIVARNRWVRSAVESI
jgi:putative flavoprotein involved in K+ transport